MTSDSDQQITVLIVDDHDLVAEGMTSLLESEHDINIVGRARTVHEAQTSVERHRPDVVLMDYRLPDGTGVDATKYVRSLDPPPAVIMVTAADDRRVFSQAIEVGCCGFVSKNADRADLLEAVRSAAAGDSYFTRDVLKHLVHLHRFEQSDGTELTDREVEVLQATADGKTAEEIATTLFLSPHTVKNHLRHTMTKLDAHTKLDAVVKALRARLISIDE